MNFTEETEVQQNEKEQTELTTTSPSKSSVTLLASYSMSHREILPHQYMSNVPSLKFIHSLKQKHIP